MSLAASTAGVYTEFSGLGALRAQARSDTPEALKEVASQFESMFLKMMLPTFPSVFEAPTTAIDPALKKTSISSIKAESSI